MLKVEHMTLRFGELIANNDISLEVPDHKVIALIGPNGAGKTTCFNCISGVYNANEGSITLDGVNIKGKQPYQVHNLGVSRTYQIINLFAEMSVVENVIVAMHADLKANFFDSMVHTKKHRQEEKAAQERALELLEFVGLREKANLPAGSLPYGEQRLLEIVRGLACIP